MDEATWLTTMNDRTWMLEHIRGKMSPRRMRLFACACVRRVWEMLPPEAREAVQIAERYADGIADGPALMRVAGIVGMLPRERGIQAVVCATEPNVERTYHAATFALADAGPEHWRDHLAKQCDLARCVFGNPFRKVAPAAWMQNAIVQQMAQAIALEGRFSDVAILADAIEDAGCTEDAVLVHCREGYHARGCWVVDAILGKH